MRYPSARCPGMLAIFAGLILALLTAAVLSALFLTGALRILTMVLDILVILLLGWVLFDTHYTFTEEALVLKSGPLRETIPYEEIKTALRTRGRGFIMTLDFDRLELNAGLHPERGRILLSPDREAEFLTELSRRCPGLKIQ